jgi:hypothetical protein
MRFAKLQRCGLHLSLVAKLQCCDLCVGLVAKLQRCSLHFSSVAKLQRCSLGDSVRSAARAVLVVLACKRQVISLTFLWRFGSERNVEYGCARTVLFRR